MYSRRIAAGICILFLSLSVILLLASYYQSGESKTDSTRARLSSNKSESSANIFTPAQITEVSKVSAEMKPLILKKWTGDLDGMVKRGLVRVLVPYGMTYYFHDGAAERGPVAEAGKKLEKFLNQKYKKKKKKIYLAFIPVARDELISGLNEGRGDIAAGGITITPLRQKLLDFTEPTLRNVAEVVVSSKEVGKLSGLAELSGRKIYVRKASSYYENLLDLNEDFKDAGKKPVTIEFLDESLEAGEVLEMVNTGIIPITVVDSHLAIFWGQIFDDIIPQTDLIVGMGQDIAWAFRKKSPQLKKELNAFVKQNKVGTEFGNIIFRRYFRNLKWVKNPYSTTERKRFDKTVEIFKRYGKKYDFDYLMLAAQGYQESKLNQNVESSAGAVGVMQILPHTGKSLDVGDIRKLEPNIHAGAKYMRVLIDTYFDDKSISDLDKMLFALASYNAGPTRISRLRLQASALGLDEDKWFNNVELIVAQEIGQEPVRYVRNIHKYQLAYQMARANNERKYIAKKKQSN